MSHTPGPVETLARLSLQSQRYVGDADYRDAVDAVLGHPQYDAAPALVAALEKCVAFLAQLETPDFDCEHDEDLARMCEPEEPNGCIICETRAALKLAKGE